MLIRFDMRTINMQTRARKRSCVVPYVYGVALCGMLIPGTLISAGLPASRVSHPPPIQVSAWARAWAMVGHDPQRTNRSPIAGPLHPHLLFTYQGSCAASLIGRDGGIYSWCMHGLTALSAGGRLRWTAPVKMGEGGPAALAPNGLILASANNGLAEYRHQFVVALSTATGQRRWTVDSLPWASVQGDVPNSKGVAPLVTAGNVLYVPFIGPERTNAGVQVFSPAGKPLRRLLPAFAPLTIALGRDGAVYELGGGGLVALTPAGKLLWTQFKGLSGLLVGKQGTIYAGNGSSVIAYAPSGRLLWQRDVPDGVAALAERADGTLLVVGATGLSALSPDGTRVWRYAFGRSLSAASTAPSIAVDAMGRAYIGGNDGIVRVIGPQGSPLWTLHAGGPSTLTTASCILGPHGELVVTGTDGALRVYR